MGKSLTLSCLNGSTELKVGATTKSSFTRQRHRHANPGETERMPLLTWMIWVLGNLVDAIRPLWPEDSPAIYSITHSGSRLRVSWAEQRLHLIPCPEENEENTEMYWKAFLKQHRRCFHHFDFDATLGFGSLVMGKIPTGGSYPALQDPLLDDLDPYIPRNSLEVIKLQTRLRNLESSPDVLRRSLNLQTGDQSKIDVTSANKHQDAFDGPLLSSIRNHLLSGTAPLKGMFYWLVGKEPLQRYVGSRVYPKQNRFSVEGQCTEAEVMDVLRGMREAG